MAVIGEGFDHVGASMDEVAVQLSHLLRVFEHRFRHEGAGLQVALAFERKQVTFGADDGPLGQSFEQTGFGDGGVCHVCSFVSPSKSVRVHRR